MQRDKFKVRSFPDLGDLQASSIGRSLRVCIATEEIVGPVRNGGIASTYYHLARMLADDGHKVTVLFLKGNRCENKTIDHWVEQYKSYGIEFIALPFETINQFGFAPFWQRRYYAFYRWLSEQVPFDVVHTSEWRGGAFYALSAKRMGLAFQDTLFLVKSSSPHIWNRHYQMRTIENDSMLACSFAEQKTVEWADIVIGGSAHLLTFMESVGYKLPEGRMYVQPNVIDLQDLQVVEKRPPYKYGEKVKSEEIVFFGRLEARKGLEIFCDALDQVVAEGSVLPKKVYFLGKQGQNMPTHPDVPNIEYIQNKSTNWPFEIEVLSNFDQKEAIGFLCAKPRISVMPSLIENSTMTVYEALVHKVPFLATNVGGTPELIESKYHKDTLTEPNPGVLAVDLCRILQEGGTVAEAAFDYTENLLIWRRFHYWLSSELSEKSVSDVIDYMTYDSKVPVADSRPMRPIKPTTRDNTASQDVSLAAVVYHNNDLSGLRLTLASLQDQIDDSFNEIIVMTDGSVSKATEKDYVQLKASMPNIIFKETKHRCIAASYNAAIQEAASNHLVFFRTGEHIAKEYMANLLKRTFTLDHVRVVVSVFDYIQDPAKSCSGKSMIKYRYLPMGGDLAAHVFHDGALGGECFAVSRSLVRDKEGFAPSYHMSNVETEFLARCALEGEELWVLPEVLYESYGIVNQNLHYNRESGKYLRIRPLVEQMPYNFKRLFLRLGDIFGDPTNESFISRKSTKSRDIRLQVQGSPQIDRAAPVRMGLIVDLDSKEFACVIPSNAHEGDEGTVVVKAEGLPFTTVPLSKLGGNFVVAKWKFDLSPKKVSQSLLTFEYATQSKRFVRTVNLIWGSDNTVYINSSKQIVNGSVNEQNARSAIPSKHNQALSMILKGRFIRRVRKRLSGLR